MGSSDPACRPYFSAKPAGDGAPPKPKRSKKLPETGPATYTTAERPPKWEGPAHRFMSWNVAGLRGVLKKVRHRPGGRHMARRSAGVHVPVLPGVGAHVRAATLCSASLRACLLPPCQDAAVLKMLVETEQVDVLCLQVSAGACVVTPGSGARTRSGVIAVRRITLACMARLSAAAGAQDAAQPRGGGGAAGRWVRAERQGGAPLWRLPNSTHSAQSD